MSDGDIRGLTLVVSIVPVLCDTALSLIDVEGDTVLLSDSFDEVVGCRCLDQDRRLNCLIQNRLNLFFEEATFLISADCKCMLVSIICHI